MQTASVLGGRKFCYTEWIKYQGFVYIVASTIIFAIQNMGDPYSCELPSDANQRTGAGQKYSNLYFYIVSHIITQPV